MSLQTTSLITDLKPITARWEESEAKILKALHKPISNLKELLNCILDYNRNLYLVLLIDIRLFIETTQGNTITYLGRF